MLFGGLHLLSKADVNPLTLDLQPPDLASQPLRFRTIEKLPHLRCLNVDYSLTPSTEVLGMYPLSFIDSELKTMDWESLQEITICGHPSSQILLFLQFTQDSYSVMGRKL